MTHIISTVRCGGVRFTNGGRLLRIGGAVRHPTTFLVRPQSGLCLVRDRSRLLHLSATLAADPSSKLEETTKRLREKHTEKLKEIQKIQDLDKRIKSVVELDQETSKAMRLFHTEEAVGVQEVKKKSLWQRFVDEVNHYKSGFVLLFLDTKVSCKIVWMILNGKTLTRRESNQLVRTVGDLFRLVPFSVFVIVPFMEFLLPVALKLFPGMLPSTFTTSSERDLKDRRKLVAKLEYAKFLQKTLDEMTVKDSGSGRSSESARDFANFYKQITSSGEAVSNEQILKFSKLFEDDITLDNMTRSQLAALCRILELPTVGSKNMLAFSIEMRLRHLKADDQVIRREGIANMTVSELQVACKDRGMRAIGLSKENLDKQLTQWLDLSLDHEVPPSLLLLSRTLYLPDSLDPLSQLAATISALPESVASRTSAEIGSKEGKVRNVDQLEVIKEEQRKIEEEALEEARKEQLAEVLSGTSSVNKVDNEAYIAQAAPDLVPTPTAESVVTEATRELKEATVAKSGELEEVRDEELLVDKAPSLTTEVQPSTPDKKPPSLKDVEVLQEVEDKRVPLSQRALSANDFADLKVAMEKLGKAQNEMTTIDDLKKELKDYKEDVEDLARIKEMVQRSGIQETIGAKLLFSRVNKMLGKVDNMMETLEQKRKETSEEPSDLAIAPEQAGEGDLNHLVTINELINIVQTTEGGQQNVEHIVEVLNLMDEDSDGVVKVDHVMKVIELLGSSGAKLPAKQMRQIVDMLSKEEMLRVEENIEGVMEKSVADQPEKKLERELRVLEKAATVPKDSFSITKDKAREASDPSSADRVHGNGDDPTGNDKNASEKKQENERNA